MPKAAKFRKKIQTQKSQEIVFKQPSLFRRVVSFVTAYSMMFLNITPVFATNITGVTGNNGVYDINATKVSGSTGFRQYTDFTLDNGDVANLKYDQGYNKFVNLVNNQVNINGIVNTVKNNNFYNGHAIFVSPNGIVVGASGVLNVGSLTMATPRQETYGELRRAYEGRVTYDIADYEHGAEKYNDLLKNSEGMVTLNGITNANITGNGTINMTKSGLQIDNYSTRTLVFNDINTDTKTATNNFIINGKSQAEFADKAQAISGQKAYDYFYPMTILGHSNKPSFESLPTTGVHFVTSDTEIVGTTINNLYDNNHPLADTFDIPNPTATANVIINGDINTDTLNIANKSGDIAITAREMATTCLNLSAINGEVDINVHNDEDTAKVTIRPADRLFAANGINVKCQVSIVEGNLAQIKFKDLPKDVANKITFRYMRMANR